jgi:hypothetical protein
MSHEPFNEELLSAYLDDELSPEERTRVDTWLAESTERQQLLAELQALRGEIQALPKYSLDEKFRRRVLGTIRMRIEDYGSEEMGVAPLAPEPAEPKAADAVQRAALAPQTKTTQPTTPSRRNLPSWEWLTAGMAATLLIGLISFMSYQQQDLELGMRAAQTGQTVDPIQVEEQLRRSATLAKKEAAPAQAAATPPVVHAPAMEANIASPAEPQIANAVAAPKPTDLRSADAVAAAPALRPAESQLKTLKFDSQELAITQALALASATPAGELEVQVAVENPEVGTTWLNDFVALNVIEKSLADPLEKANERDHAAAFGASQAPEAKPAAGGIAADPPAIAATDKQKRAGVTNDIAKNAALTKQAPAGANRAAESSSQTVEIPVDQLAALLAAVRSPTNNAAELKSVKFIATESKPFSLSDANGGAKREDAKSFSAKSNEEGAKEIKQAKKQAEVLAEEANPPPPQIAVADRKLQSKDESAAGEKRQELQDFQRETETKQPPATVRVRFVFVPKTPEKTTP